MKVLQTIAAIVAGIIVAIFITIFSGFVLGTTVVFPKGTVDVELNLPAQENCFEPWVVLCVTNTGKVKSYLLSINSTEPYLQMTATEKFLRMAYFVLLFRPIDESGLAFYKGALDGGAMTREQVLDSIIGGSEYKRLRP